MKDGRGKCRKKIYDAWVCMPPRETIIINKIEHSEVRSKLKQKFQSRGVIDYTHNFTKIVKPSEEIINKYNKGETVASEIVEAYSLCCELVRNGKVYITSNNTPFVLCGSIGEFSVISFGTLQNRYKLLSENGASSIGISKEVLSKKLKNGCLEWVRVRCVPDKEEYYAQYIPLNNMGRIQGKILENGINALQIYNGKGVKHGKGDFLIYRLLPNGVPSREYCSVVNGLVFALTFDNHGWTEEIDQNVRELTIEKPKPLFEIEEKKDAGANNSDKNSVNNLLMNSIEEVLRYCRDTSIKQMPFMYKRLEDSFVVQPKVIESYESFVNDSEKLNENQKKSALKQLRFNRFITEIKIKNDMIYFNSFNILKDSSGKETKSQIYCVKLPATQEGIQMLREKTCIYLGLSGYIPNEQLGHFTYIAKPSKYEYDGLEAYTISSSGINRKLRLMDYESDNNHRGYEREGIESQRLYRVIDGADKYMAKSTLSKPTFVFRGLPGNTAVAFSGSGDLANLPGHILTNTAFTSTTLNMHSTLMFANTGADAENGVILAIELPAGINAEYIHNIAGWKEQFEILLDRKYDLAIGEKLLEFEGANKFTYHVFLANVVEHAPFSEIPGFIDVSHHSNVPNIKYYDENGKINFTYELIKGYMKEAYHILRQKGIAGAQFQEKLRFTETFSDYIVVRAGKSEETNTVTDLAFTYNKDTDLLDVVKFVSPDVVITESGAEVTARNYWKDFNRNNNSIDRNFVWESYEANNMAFTIKDKDNPDGNFQIIPKSSITLKGDSKSKAERIANTIIEYVKYNKDVTLLPMQDIGRYFDCVFRATLITEGYLLKDALSVDRVGNPDDENDGYVKMGYLIDGDNDDSLMLKMKLSRDENMKLKMDYNGKSKDGILSETQNMRWNIFDQEVMEKTCDKILYQFASKLKLNHTRRIDALMRYVERLTGFKVVNHAFNKDGLNIHQKGNVKAYKLYTDIKNNEFMLINIVVENRIAQMRFRTLTGEWNMAVSLDNSIQTMYREVMQSICQGLKEYPIQSLERKMRPVEVGFKNTNLGMSEKRTA